MMPQITQDVWTQKRIYSTAGILVLAGLLGAGWLGYSWYMRSKEQSAYKDLAESIDGYTKTRMMPGGAEKWVDVERGFRAGAERNPSTKLQPYFLAFEAEALLEQGKSKEAIGLLDKAVGMISRNNSLYFLYALKRALMKIDSSDEVLQKSGRQELAELAKDTANPVQDMARYYSGLDALSRGDTAAAKNFFQEVGQPTSFWYQMAQDKLREL